MAHSKVVVVTLALALAMVACGGASNPTQPGPTAKPCVGDCNGDGAVTVEELLIAWQIAQGNAPIGVCRSADGSGDGAVTVDELTQAHQHAQTGCPK